MSMYTISTTIHNGFEIENVGKKILKLNHDVVSKTLAAVGEEFYPFLSFDSAFLAYGIHHGMITITTTYYLYTSGPDTRKIEESRDEIIRRVSEALKTIDGLTKPPKVT